MAYLTLICPECKTEQNVFDFMPTQVECRYCKAKYAVRGWSPTNILSVEKIGEKKRRLRDRIAYKFALEAHAGQLDDLGKDYFKTHVEPIGEATEGLLQQSDATEEIKDQVIDASLLHDCPEDTAVTEEELRKHFSKFTCDLVMAVTHAGKKDAGGYYFPRLLYTDDDKMTPEERAYRLLVYQFATMIKCVDRASNVSRMSAWSDDRKLKYLNKTRFWETNPNEKKVWIPKPDKDGSYSGKNEKTN
jgi:(p)ppGpp synthase/HD superfamily hydrolase